MPSLEEIIITITLIAVAVGTTFIYTFTVCQMLQNATKCYVCFLLLILVTAQ